MVFLSDEFTGLVPRENCCYDDVFVFPNPVDLVDELFIVGENDLPLQMTIYNSSGGKIFETVLTGVIKAFQTHGFQPGNYFFTILHGWKSIFQ